MTRHESDKGRLFIPQDLAPYESGVRSVINESANLPYYPLLSLEEAQSYPDGVVILEGDDGGQIYVVAPAALVGANIQTLERLLRDLDALAWPDNDKNMARIFYERLPAGAVVAGGAGGGRVLPDIWIHPEFVERGIAGPIQDIIVGNSQSLATDPP
jgi:hypothetical protein